MWSIKKIFPNSYPYKFYVSRSPTIVSVLFFDVIADKAHKDPLSVILSEVKGFHQTS